MAVFQSKNRQSDGRNKLKRIEFELYGDSYVFPVNPEEYSQTETNRAEVTQTKGGAWTDEFGSGIPIITLKGTTGFKNGTTDPTVGFAKFKSLRDKIRAHYNAVTSGQPLTPKDELIFHNYTDGEHWVCLCRTFRLYRSVSRPLLYAYDIEMICLRPASEPSGYTMDAPLNPYLIRNGVKI